MFVILFIFCVDDVSIEEGYKIGVEVYIIKLFDMDLFFI